MRNLGRRPVGGENLCEIVDMARKTYVRRAFGGGIARTIAVNGGINLRRHRSSAFIRHDDEAFASDWNAVAGDLRQATDAYASGELQKRQMNGHG
jgi:hypothetical protein